MLDPCMAPKDHAGFASESQEQDQNCPKLNIKYQGCLLNILLAFVQLSVTFHSNLPRTS